MYRDDATALGEQGAALEQQLATLRAAGPPGAVARIDEIRAEQRALGRFGWAYAWLAGLALMWLVPHLAGFAIASAFVLLPPTAALLHLWLELGEQRRRMTQRRRELADRMKLKDSEDAATRSAGPASRPAVVAAPASTELSAVVAHQEDLARELAVYRASGTRDQALDAELTRESEDLARHGRPFLWLAAALLVLVMPVTKEEPFDLLPVVLGSMTLALGSFGVRIATHAQRLAARLEVARRDLQRAEVLLGSALDPDTYEGVTEALRVQTEATRRGRREVERLRELRDQHLGSASRAGITVFACLIALVAMLASKGPLSAYALITACLAGLLAAVTLFFGARSGAALARTGRDLRLAELEEDTAEEHLHRLRETSPGPTSAGISPRARVDLENVLEEEVPSSARYHRQRELP